MTRPIAILGAGRIGQAVTATLLDAGRAVTVWNRTAAKCAPLAERGAHVASSVAEAVHGADLVIALLSDYEATLSLLGEEESSALRDTVLVQLASGTPRQARETAAWAAERKICYLDGAIMATPDLIGRPGCTILYSGPPALFEGHRAIFALLGGNPIFVGSDVSHAKTLDNSLLVVLWGALYGLLCGAAICEAEKFPLESFRNSLPGIIPVIQGSMDSALERIGRRQFAADQTTAATVETCHASIRYLLQIGRDHGLDVGLLSAFDRVFQATRQAGQEQADFSAVYQGMRPPI